ncbi:hypothetical protein SDC9_41611 [bioreactor metagenome]|uniref:Uncharacterized protein n=1 Tax=bioreactor metagenome TaxID=1076179 RepID=A0A644VW40_9ZZZZ
MGRMDAEGKEGREDRVPPSPERFSGVLSPVFRPEQADEDDRQDEQREGKGSHVAVPLGNQRDEAEQGDAPGDEDIDEGCGDVHLPVAGDGGAPGSSPEGHDAPGAAEDEAHAGGDDCQENQEGHDGRAESAASAVGRHVQHGHAFLEDGRIVEKHPRGGKPEYSRVDEKAPDGCFPGVLPGRQGIGHGDVGPHGAGLETGILHGCPESLHKALRGRGCADDLKQLGEVCHEVRHVNEGHPRNDDDRHGGGGPPHHLRAEDGQEEDEDRHDHRVHYVGCPEDLLHHRASGGEGHRRRDEKDKDVHDFVGVGEDGLEGFEILVAPCPVVERFVGYGEAPRIVEHRRDDGNGQDGGDQGIPSVGYEKINELSPAGEAAAEMGGEPDKGHSQNSHVTLRFHAVPCSSRVSCS